MTGNRPSAASAVVPSRARSMGGADSANRAHSSHIARIVTLLAVTLALLFSGIGPAASDTDTYPAEVLVTRITPTVLTTGDEVTLRAEITNTGDQPLEAIALGLHLSPAALQTSEAVDAWLAAPPSDTSSSETSAVTVEDPIEPGATAVIPVTFTRNQLGAHLTDAGIRGVAIEVVARRGESGSRIRQGMGRTVIPWWSERAEHPLAIIAPLTGPLASPDDEEAGLAKMEQATASGSDLMNAVAAIESVSWITPAIELNTVGRAQESGPLGQLWATRLQIAAQDRPVIYLPTYDVDLAVVSQDERSAELFTRPGPDATFTVPESTNTVAVAAPGPVTEQMIETAQNAGYRRIVAPPVTGEDAPPAVWTTSEETGAVSIHHGDAAVTALFADDTDSEPATNTQAELAQSLLTVIGREEGAPVLVTLDRNWTARATTVRETAHKLETMPWFDPTDALALLGQQTPELAEAQSGDHSAGVLEVDHLDVLLTAADIVDDISRITIDPVAITSGFRPKMLAPLAVGARADSSRQTQLIQFATSEARSMEHPIELVPGSVVNLISQSGEVPVQLTNTLEVDAEVMVFLRPDHPRLIAHPSEPVIVPGGGTATAHVPVEAVGSGNVAVTVTIADSQGSLLTVAETMTVRVRADWETVGTAIVGGILVLGLIFGIVRTVRRGKGKSRARMASVPVQKATTE